MNRINCRKLVAVVSVMFFVLVIFAGAAKAINK